MGKRLIVLWVVFAAVCLTVIPAKSFAAAFNRFDTQSYIIHVRFSPFLNLGGLLRKTDMGQL